MPTPERRRSPGDGPLDVRPVPVRRIREDAVDKQLDTLADIALYYWIARPASGDEERRAGRPGKGTTTCPDLDSPRTSPGGSTSNFNAISFGAEGTLDAANLRPPWRR